MSSAVIMKNGVDFDDRAADRSDRRSHSSNSLKNFHVNTSLIKSTQNVNECDQHPKAKSTVFILSKKKKMSFWKGFRGFQNVNYCLRTVSFLFSKVFSG